MPIDKDKIAALIDKRAINDKLTLKMIEALLVSIAAGEDTEWSKRRTILDYIQAIHNELTGAHAVIEAYKHV